MKKTKKNNTKNKNIKKSSKKDENLIAIAMIILGILIGLFATKNLGFIGRILKIIILSLFSKYVYILSIILISLGSYKLFSKKFKFKNLNKIDFTIFILMTVFSFVLFNINYAENIIHLKGKILKTIINDSLEYKGIGLIPYFLTFIFTKLFGKSGVSIFIILSILYLLLKYRTDKIKIVAKNINNFIASKKIKRKDNIKRKEKTSNTTEENKIIDKKIFDDFFSDAPVFNDERKNISENIYDLNIDTSQIKPSKKEKASNLLQFDTPLIIKDKIKKKNFSFLKENTFDLEEFSKNYANESQKNYTNESIDKPTIFENNNEKKSNSNDLSFAEKVEFLYDKYTENLATTLNEESNKDFNIWYNKEEQLSKELELKKESPVDKNEENNNLIRDKNIENNDTNQNNLKTKATSDVNFNNVSKDNFQPFSPITKNKEIDSLNLSSTKEKSQEKIDIETNLNSIKKDYIFPTINLLNNFKKEQTYDKKEKLKKAEILIKTLNSFGVEARVENICVGPTITRYEVKPKQGTKVSKITNLSEDLALSLAAKSIRIEAPIPGKSYVGIEIPNNKKEAVTFSEVIKNVNKNKYKIAFAMGKDIAGNVIISDITKMPHILIAGATGSGKSVCINTLISSILYNYSPDEVKMILIDPKVVELASYSDIPHLVIPVVTDMDKASLSLSWAVNEMEKRYSKFASTKTRDIEGYNKKTSENNHEKMARIVIIIDELADLMMAAAKDVEDSICRLAQKARACGIHLVVATQRPSVDVITGLIKANIPSRIAFSVSSVTDSRTILDSGGAEKLLGKGDMLYLPIGENKPIRIQGAFLTDEEVENITNFVRENNSNDEILLESQQSVEQEIENIEYDNYKTDNLDPLYYEILNFAIENGEVSTSLIQRKFKIGYNRAARIIDEFEEKGVVGKMNGSKPRKVLIDN